MSSAEATDPRILDGTISEFYGYLPTLSICILFTAVYSLLTIVHLGQALHTRAHWLLPTLVLGGVGESIGWIGRLWSHYAPKNNTPFMIQIITTLMAPTFILASLFIAFGRVVGCMGTEYSRLGPRLYFRVFLACDIVAAFIQGAGGGIAGSAKDPQSSALGSDIILSGIVFQSAAMLVFSALIAEYAIRYAAHRPVGSSKSGARITERATDPRMKLLLSSVASSTGLLIIRAIYRIIELSDGWTGTIIRTEKWFNWFDALMVALAMLALNVAHPGYILKDRTPTDADVRMSNKLVRNDQEATSPLPQ